MKLFVVLTKELDGPSVVWKIVAIHVCAYVGWVSRRHKYS